MPIAAEFFRCLRRLLGGTKLEAFAFLYVVRGEPYQTGTCLHLQEAETCIGRSGHETSPDISFSNAFVSRRHVKIVNDNGKAMLYDLGSRHGTEVNGVMVEPGTACLLRSSDLIRLAKGMVILRFAYAFEEQTLEFEPIIVPEGENPDLPYEINWEKREFSVDGVRIAMSEKEAGFLKLMFDHRNSLVAFDAIKKNVWPERAADCGGVPDVSMDELNALVYRIRKKYGNAPFQIRAVRGTGYILENAEE